MAALNYYLGFQRGANGNPYLVTAGTSPAGTSVDVEVNIQINNGTSATGITCLDVRKILDTIDQVVADRVVPSFLPVL